jgi:hypothetical protein
MGNRPIDLELRFATGFGGSSKLRDLKINEGPTSPPTPPEETPPVALFAAA